MDATAVTVAKRRDRNGAVQAVSGGPGAGVRPGPSPSKREYGSQQAARLAAVRVESAFRAGPGRRAMTERRRRAPPPRLPPAPGQAGGGGDRRHPLARPRRARRTRGGVPLPTGSVLHLPGAGRHRRALPLLLDVERSRRPTTIWPSPSSGSPAVRSPTGSTTTYRSVTSSRCHRPSGTFRDPRRRRSSDHRVLRRQRHHAGDLDRQERRWPHRGGRSASSTPTGIPTRSSSTGPLRDLETRYPGRLTVDRHFDSVSGFPDAEAVVDVVGGDPDADFYVCGPVRSWSWSSSTLLDLGVRTRSHPHRALRAPEPGPEVPSASDPPGATVPSTIVLQLKGKRHEIGYHRRRHRARDRPAGQPPAPYSCEAGSCATCMALVLDGSVTMRVNNALTPDEVEEGWILTCQSWPVGSSLHVDYEDA